MDNLNYIFEYNNCKKKKIEFSNKKQIVCQINYPFFGSLVINQVIGFVKSLNIGLKGFPIVFRFNKNIKLKDKLSYIIFECICYDLIELGYTVYVDMRCKHDIQTCGIICSPLNLLYNGNCHKFVEKFNNDLYENHFCKLITNAKNNPEYLSVLYYDIDCFLKNSGINDSRRNDLAETISELIGNACEHTSSNCYIDIDIADDYYKKGDDDDLDFSTKYYGVNIVILNFSKNLLNKDIKNRVKNCVAEIDRYKKLLEAYNYHKQFFNELYSEDDFFNIAVFQNRISGSIDKNEVGGTGLTYLINSLQQKSDSDDCYVLSGNNVVCFQKEYLCYNDDWIGFNKSNNFISDIPEMTVFDRSHMFFPGTAYNLNFVMESENENE